MLPDAVQQALETADSTINKAIEENHLPGIGIGLVYQGVPIYAKGFGLADVRQDVSVTAETVFRIASISKTFAAIALMQLWEQGKFDLHAPVNDFLKGYKVQHKGSQPITFHHLLTHTAGLGEFASLWKYLSPVAHFNVVLPGGAVPELRKLYGRTLHAERPAGEKWCYANNGFATVGQLVADISGQSFPEYVRDHILVPLGMETADFWRSPRVKPKLAIGYKYNKKRSQFKAVPDLEQITVAAGSMNASINDMTRYVAALMNGGCNEFGQVLKPETLEMMYTPQFQLDPRLQGMGYAFKVDDWGGHRVVSHDGLWLGFISSMFVAPDAELGVVALTNSASGAAIYVAFQLLQRALNTSSRPLKKAPVAEPPEKPELWPELVGFYAPTPGWNTNFRLWQQYGNEFEVYVDGEKLHIRSNWGGWKQGYLLKPADADDPLSFVVGSTPVIFRRTAVGGMTLLKGLHRLEKRPYSQSIRRKLDQFGISKLLNYKKRP